MAELDELIQKIKAQMGETASTDHANETLAKAETLSQTKTPQKAMERADYPLYEKHPELVLSPKGTGINEITLDKVLSGEVDGQDLRITSETLKYQGEIAKSAGRSALQQNFARAAELTAVPDERLLAMYGALRPYRSSKAELLQLADELETEYNATITAKFVREAATHYEARKKLKGDN
ncbi:diol dehydratase small subunit [Enterococcus sp. CSURQ0835]|uniref:diol dehydratase small subunit n=1 Tax=Enterococcus sp. CSURQ0835 TaxID=2681394 RepID=UPI001359D251|nr:diol dehydratase small subunit [Enterococcus sp. CSURQ0835]